jgi:hypothetical protein
MVAFGPQSLACGIESAGIGGGIAVTLCPHRDMKTPGQLPGRAFSLTWTGEKVRQVDFGSNCPYSLPTGQLTGGFILVLNLGEKRLGGFG